MLTDSDFLVEYVHGRHTVREYFNRFVGERLFDAAFADCPTELRDGCVAQLWSAFAELEAIPRTDPLWAGSNMRPTFSKLRERVKVVPIDERDVERCWRTFVALCAGDLEPFRRASEVLLRSGQLSASAFVRTSLNLLDVSGWETDELAAATLLQCGSANDARSTLDDIIENGSLERPRWAKKVLRRLGENG
jgi:hypothetical protein